MEQGLKTVKLGLALVLLGLFFGVGMGIFFGVNETEQFLATFLT